MPRSDVVVRFQIERYGYERPTLELVRAISVQSLKFVITDLATISYSSLDEDTTNVASAASNKQMSSTHFQYSFRR